MTANSVTNVNTTDSGRIFVTGQRTGGLDTSALIEAAYQQRLAPAVTIDTRVAENSAKSQGYVELRNLAAALGNSIAALASTSSGETNGFDLKTGSISSSTGNTSPVTVGIDSTAELGSFNLEVISVAQSQVVNGGSQASRTDPLGLDGTFSLGVQGGGSANITVTNGLSLNDIAAAINAESDTAGVQASVYEVSAGQFQLVLETVEPGQTLSTSFVGGANNITQSLGLTDGGGNFLSVVQFPSQARISLDGVVVTRDSNDFSGVIPGVDITVNAADLGNIITVNIEEDATQVKSNIQDFVEAYNTLKGFIATQQVVSEGAGGEDTAVLFGDATLRALDREIANLINSVANPGSGIPDLAALGIELNALGDLEIDETVLDDAILNNYAEVRALFETDVTVTGAGDQAALILNSYDGANVDFTLDVTTDGAGNILSAGVGGDTSLFTVNGNSIRGVDGGPYAGLTFAYLGDASVSLDISVNAGLADRFSGVIDTYTDTSNGIIQNNITQLDETNETLTQDAERIRDRAANYQAREIERYSKLEAAVTQSQNLLRYIKALFGTGDNDS